MVCQRWCLIVMLLLVTLEPIKQLSQLEMPIIPETTSEEQHATKQESNCRYLVRRQAPPDRYSPTTYFVKRKENCNDCILRMYLIILVSFVCDS